MTNGGGGETTAEAQNGKVGRRQTSPVQKDRLLLIVMRRIVSAYSFLLFLFLSGLKFVLIRLHWLSVIYYFLFLFDVFLSFHFGVKY